MPPLLKSKSSPVERRALRAAVVGNPNVGKSSVFNLLTGASARIGNYPGITIERKTGFVSTDDFHISVVDLPGLYSLDPHSPEMQVALSELVDEQGKLPAAAPDFIICIIDSTNLLRGMLLYLECLALGYKVFPVFTMADSVDRANVDKVVDSHSQTSDQVVVDFQRLEKHLEQKLVTVDARKNSARTTLRFELEQFCRQLVKGEIKAPAWLKKFPHEKTVQEKTRFIRKTFSVFTRPSARNSLTARLDRVFLHPLLGLASFVTILFIIFQSVFSWAEPVMDFISGIMDALSESVSNAAGEGIVVDLLTGGIIAGVGNAVVFIPQIAFLFLFIAVLEDTGIMARGAFVLNRIMGSFGLSGKALVPLLSSNACAIPGIMAARTVPSFSERMAIIMVAPFMTCSARLPVYTFLIAAFVPATSFGLFGLQGLVLAGLYFIGTMAAITLAFVFRKSLFKGKSESLLLDLPPYRLPSIRNITKEVTLKVGDFLKTAGTIILFLSIIIWFLSNFPRAETAAAGPDAPTVSPASAEPLPEAEKQAGAHSQQLESSYIGRFGRIIEPVIEPLGFNWKIGITILTSFVAREVAVSTLGILYHCPSCDEDESGFRNLRERMKADQATLSNGRRVWTPLTGITLMLFYAFACQCMSTLAVIRRETASNVWPLFVFGYMSILAWLSCLAFFQVFSSLGY